MKTSTNQYIDTGECVKNTVWGFVRVSVWGSVWSSVRNSVRNSVMGSVRNSVRNSVMFSDTLNQQEIE